MRLLVDVDTHIEVSLEELARFMDQPVRREIEAAMPNSLLPGTLGAPGAAQQPPDMGNQPDAATEADFQVSCFPASCSQ